MSDTVRVVLAILLAGALLGVGLPAADRASEARAATRLDESATRLANAAERLAARNDPTRRGVARRILTLRVPPDSQFRVERDAVRWRVGDGSWHRRRPKVAVRGGGSPLNLFPGRHRLQLSLWEQHGSPVVRVTPVPADREWESPAPPGD
ncbi:MAG: hypothetical protein ABEJ05_13680 [Haloglomus sp.]